MASLMEIRRSITASQPHLDTKSGSIVSLKSSVGKAKDLVVDIESVQDLHGYDHPWPAGGGVNLWNKGNISVLGTYQSVILDEPLSAGTYTFSTAFITSGTKIPQIRLRDQDGNAISSHNLSNVTNDRRWCTFTTTEDVYRIYLYSAQGDSGVTAEYNDVQLEIGSIVTTYSPYSNICPITGWTGVKVTKCGKNLFNESNAIVEYDSNRYCKLENGLLHYKNDGGSYCYSKQFDIYLPSGSYALSLSNYRLVSGISPIWIIKIGNNPLIYPTINNDYIFRLVEPNTVTIRLSTSGTTSATEFYGNVQLELGSTATSYEPYVGSTYDITFPSAAGTVYGGTLDVVKGELVVDRATVDLGTLTWTLNPDTGANTNVSNYGLKAVASQNVQPNIIASNYTTVTRNQHASAISDGTAASLISQSNNGNYIYVGDASFTPTGQLIYELAAPITYQLTPQEIALLRGNNTIYADCGDTTITYWTN